MFLAADGMMNLKPNVVIITTMRIFYVILCLICCAPVALADGLPDLGDVSATVLSPLQEQRIADQIMREVMASDDVVSDVEITDYVQALGYRLGANGPDKSQKFNFFVVKDNTINAFAMPGGVIGVHTGLILAANSESEVAGVLGHEIGHVVQHHMARMLAQQKRDTIINMASFALAILASRANPQLAGGAMTAASAGGIQKQLDYTRENEREADRVGMQILAAAGFDTHGMSSFFETLQKGSRFSDGSAPSFLRTHPVTTERISDVKSREAAGTFRMLSYSPDFDYVKAKLVAGLNSPSLAISVFQDNLQQRKYNNEAAQHYGLAVAYLRKNDPDSAEKELKWLRTNAPKHAMFATLAANIEVTRKRPEQAAQLYAAGLAEYPGNRALIYGYAEHFLNLGQPDKVLKLVSEKQSDYPDDPYLYELMSRAYAAQGKQLLLHQAQGEAYFRRYNIPRAVEQMDLAAKAGDGDFYQRSIVEARLNQLKLLVLDPKKF
jgi:predicted Zn-dependent protease